MKEETIAANMHPGQKKRGKSILDSRQSSVNKSGSGSELKTRTKGRFSNALPKHSADLVRKDIQMLKKANPEFFRQQDKYDEYKKEMFL